MTEWFIFSGNNTGETKIRIEPVQIGFDPLYGRGSAWCLLAGPFDTFAEAVIAAAKYE
jgi:hypothetical protein